MRGVPASGSISGDVEVQRDIDWFRVDLRNGEEYTIQLFGDPLFPGFALTEPLLELWRVHNPLFTRFNLERIKRAVSRAGVAEMVFRVPGNSGKTTYHLLAGGLARFLPGTSYPTGTYKLIIEENP